MTDDRPRCTLSRPSTEPTDCYCTGRPGCRWRAAQPVCVDCGNPDCYGDCLDLRCPCGQGCWDEKPAPQPIERIDVAGELL